MTIVISLTWKDYLQVVSLPAWWKKNLTKKIILLLSIKSSPVDRFKSLRCLNDRMDLPYMMRLLASGPNNTLVTIIGTKDLATSCSVYRVWTNGRIWMLRCINDCIDLPHMMGSLASSSLVAKNWTKNYLSHLKTDFDVQAVSITILKWPTW